MNRHANSFRWVAAAVLLVGGVQISAAQDVAASPAVFAQCSVCHSIDGSNGVGPTLKGIVGRKAGSLPGFRFSRGMRAASLTWDASSLDRYLTDPQGLIPGNVMPFAGVLDAPARAELIAYLQSLK